MRQPAARPFLGLLTASILFLQHAPLPAFPYEIEPDFAIIQVAPEPVAPADTNRLHEAESVVPLSWDWASGDLLGWQGTGISGLAASDGRLTGTGSSSAPYVQVTNIDGPDLDFGFYNFLQTRMRLPEGFSGDVVFRFGTSENPGNTSSSREFRIPNRLLDASGEWETYRIDLGLIAWWRDQLTHLRVYPLGTDGSGLSFEIDYLEIGDKPGDLLLVNDDLGLASGESMGDVNFMESKHAVFWWSPESFNVDSRLNPEVHGRRALRMIEESYQVFHKILGYREPFESWDVWRRDGNRYKVNHTTWFGGFWMGGRNGFGWMNVPAGGLLDEGWGNPVPHELAHVFQGHQIDFLAGGHWESHANYLRQAWQMHHSQRFPQHQRAQLSLGPLINSNFRQDHGKLIYADFRIHHALEAVAASRPDLDADLPAQLWFEGQKDATVYDTLAQILPSGTSVADTVATGVRHWPLLDFEHSEHFRNQLWNTSRNRAWHDYATGSLLVPSQDRPGWWRVPLARAPERFAYMYHELEPTASSVTVELEGLELMGSTEDWRWSLVAVNGDGEARYSEVFTPGAGTITLEPDEVKVLVIVVATPTDTSLNLEWTANRLPLDQHLDRLRYPYELRIQGAEPAKRQLDWNTGAGAPHPNGGGWVANSATVEPTAYVGPNARVLDNAVVSHTSRIEDYAVVAQQARVEGSGGRSSASPVVSGYAVVRGDARISGNARIRDRAVVMGSAQVGGNAVVTEYALIEGNTSIGGNAIARGQTSPWGGSISGDAILDYDYSMTESLSDGVHFSHVPWGGWYVPYWVETQAKPRGLTASYRINEPAGSLLWDEFGAAHALLRGNAHRVNDPWMNTSVLRLDGTSAYAVLDRNLAAMTAATYSLWVRPDGANTDRAVLHFGGAEDRFLQIIARDTEGRARVRMQTEGGLTELISQSAVPEGQWTHIALTISTNRSATLYIDGSSEASTFLNALPEAILAPNDFTVGEAVYLGRDWHGNLFAGDLVDFRAYNVPLSADEIAAEKLRTGPLLGAFFVKSPQDFTGSGPEFQSGVRDGLVRTLQATIYPRSGGSGTYYAGIFDSSDEETASIRGSGFGLRNGRIFVRLANVGFWDTGVDATLNDWQTITLTYDGNEAVLYVDGIEMARRNYNANPSHVAGKNFRIGFAQSAGGSRPKYHFDGDITDALISDRVIPPSPPSTIEDWRAEHFGTSENAGLAADDADFDGDGFMNLIEYALGANPTVPGDAATKLNTGRTRLPADQIFQDSFSYAADLIADGPDGTGWDRITGVEEASVARIEAQNGVLHMTSSGTWGDAYPLTIARSVPGGVDLQATVRLVSAPSTGDTFDRDYVNFTAPMLYIGRADNPGGVSHYVAHHFFEAFGHGNGMQVVQNYSRTFDGSFTPSPGYPWMRIEFDHITGEVTAWRSQDGQNWQDFGSQTLPALVAAGVELEIGLIHTVWGNADADNAWVEWDDFEIRDLSGEPGETEEEYLFLNFEHIGDPRLLYIIEATNDLNAGWETVQTYGPFMTSGSESFTDEVPLGHDPRRFLRLRVEYQ